MEATVYNKKVNGPATHAIVIGVGHYSYLPGGKGKTKFANPGGMKQLKSPPESARAIARWLIEGYHNLAKPLGTVSLLLSDAKSQAFEFEINGKKTQTTVPMADMKNVSTAVEAWHALGHTNADHLVLFFFCGHGIAAVPDLSLLLADFGEKATAPLNGAIDFRLFRQNMDECLARQQCYFIDACRVGSDLLIKNGGFAGLPIIQKVGTMNTTGRLRQSPTFYSTLADAPAYAKPGKPSLFTEALLEGLNGAGCEEPLPGEWQVQTTLLNHALNKLMIDASERLQVPQWQITPADDLTLIALNTVAAPLIPVVVSCVPSDANSEATFSYDNGTLKSKRGPNKDSWKLILPVGEYDFSAEFKAAKFKAFKRRSPIRPTFPFIPLEAKP